MSDEKMTQLQGQKLAELINALRPSWGTNGIFEAIGGAVTGNMGDAHEVSLAAIRAARDPTNKTPAIIRLPGKHWSVEQDLADTRAELKAAKDRIAGKYSAPDTNDPWCEDHPDQRLSFCKECAKEKVPMPPNFRELAGIAPKLPRKRHRSVEEAETGQEPTDNETKPGEGHTA